MNSTHSSLNSHSAVIESVPSLFLNRIQKILEVRNKGVKRLYSNSGESGKINVLSDEVANTKNHLMNALLTSKDSKVHPDVPMFTYCSCTPSSLFITKVLTL